MKIKGSRKQRGVVILLVTMVLPVLLLAAGFALDFGHVFVNKTRLQNALDATALSAAIAINSDINKDKAAATTKGIATFNLFKAASGNDELAGLNAGSLVFEYAKTVNPWVSFNANTDPFAFVKVTSTNMLQVTPVLIRILNQFSSDIPVPAIATAGPVGNNCSLAPIIMCAGIPLDTICKDGACYGYTIGAPNMNLTQRSNKVQAGYYDLKNVSPATIYNALTTPDIPSPSTCPGVITASLTTNQYTWTGTSGVRNGINARFNSDTADTSAETYTQYKSKGRGNNRRVLGVRMANCSQTNKSTLNLPIVATACVFLRALATSTVRIPYEFMGPCPQNSAWDPTNPVLNGGPYKIVLFKSPGSSDS